MLESYRGTIDLIQFFKDRYNYDYIDLPELLKQDFIYCEGVGNSALFWIIDGSERYLYKEGENYLGELFSEQVAKVLNMPCAEYRTVTLGENKGIISRNFMNEKDNMILGAQIIQEVLNNYPQLVSRQKNIINEVEENEIFQNKQFLELYGVPDKITEMNPCHRLKYLLNNLNNLEQLDSILYLFFRGRNISEEDCNFIVYKIMNHLVEIFMFDILTIQSDRHIENWGIGQNGQYNFYNIPLFDNNAAFCLFDDIDKKRENLNKAIQDFESHPSTKCLNIVRDIIYKNKPLLSVSEDDIINPTSRKRVNNMLMLEHFLSISSDYYIDKFMKYVQVLEEYTIDRIIDDIVNFHDVFIDDTKKEYIRDMYKYNMKFINEVCDKYLLRKKL